MIKLIGRRGAFIRVTSACRDSSSCCLKSSRVCGRTEEEVAPLIGDKCVDDDNDKMLLLLPLLLL